MGKGFFNSKFDLNRDFDLEREFDLSREFYREFSLFEKETKDSSNDIDTKKQIDKSLINTETSNIK